MAASFKQWKEYELVIVFQLKKSLKLSSHCQFGRSESSSSKRKACIHIPLRSPQITLSTFWLRCRSMLPFETSITSMPLSSFPQYIFCSEAAITGKSNVETRTSTRIINRNPWTNLERKLQIGHPLQLDSIFKTKFPKLKWRNRSIFFCIFFFWFWNLNKQIDRKGKLKKMEFLKTLEPFLLFLSKYFLPTNPLKILKWTLYIGNLEASILFPQENPKTNSLKNLKFWKSLSRTNSGQMECEDWL